MYFTYNSESELPGTEGGDGWSVPDRNVSRSPGGPVGRHGVPGHGAAPTGRRYPHLRSHTQVGLKGLHVVWLQSFSQINGWITCF